MYSIVHLECTFFENKLWSVLFKYSFTEQPLVLFFQVGSIIELRRSYQAYNVMPGLSNALKRYGV